MNVKKAFNAAAKSYATHATIQSKVGEDLAEQLDPIPPHAHVLELGCGTGILTELLRFRFPDASILAMDIAPDMLRQAHRYVPSAQFVEADLNTLSLNESFDLITSSSAMHWVDDFSALLKTLAGALRPNGTLHFSLMIHDSLVELHTARAKIGVPAHRRLITAEAVKSALAENDFVINESVEKTWEITYPSSAHLLRSLQAQGVTGGLLSCGASPLFPL